MRAEIANKNLYTRGQKRSPKKSRRPRFRDEDLNVLFFLVRQGCAQHPLEHHSGRLCKRRDFLQILWVSCSNSACLVYQEKRSARKKHDMAGLRQNVLSQNGYGPTAPTGLGPRAPGGRGVDGVAEGRARDLSRPRSRALGVMPRDFGTFS